MPLLIAGHFGPGGARRVGIAIYGFDKLKILTSLSKVGCMSGARKVPGAREHVPLAYALFRYGL